MTDLQVGIIALVAALAVVLIWHAATRDRNVRRTRWGVFIERDRYGEVSDLDTDTHTYVHWPTRKPDSLELPTQELKPDKQTPPQV